MSRLDALLHIKAGLGRAIDELSRAEAEAIVSHCAPPGSAFVAGVTHGASMGLTNALVVVENAIKIEKAAAAT